MGHEFYFRRSFKKKEDENLRSWDACRYHLLFDK